MESHLQTVSLLFSFGLIASYVISRFNQTSISKIPGPPTKSWLFGNVTELLQGQAGELDFHWHSKYGNVVRLTGPLGTESLMLSDPKAIHHILQSASENYLKASEGADLVGLIHGREGVLSVEGDDHKRQRKVIVPAFGVAECRTFLPFFQSRASQLCLLLARELGDSDSGPAVVNIADWFSRLTLDAIGDAAFDYDFSALDNEDNELARSCRGLFLELFARPPSFGVLVITIAKYIPHKIWEWILLNSRSPQVERAKKHEKLASNVARALLDAKADLLKHGDGNLDVMSRIVKENASKTKSAQLSEAELLSELQTILLAGHETTANGLTWSILELCRNPDIQRRLRDEIQSTEAKIRERGDAEFSWRDYDGMPYLTAVIKESLRFNPILYFIPRQPAKDDVIPLSEPIQTVTGELAHELLVPKGISIAISVAQYNRLESIFGKDAHVFNPDRWLKNEVQTKDTVGVYSHLLTFGAGSRTCLGWRFALLELQSFLVEVVRNFEFALDVPVESIRREATGVMAPTLVGQFEKGVQLPVRLSTVSRDEGW